MYNVLGKVPRELMQLSRKRSTEFIEILDNINELMAASDYMKRTAAIRVSDCTVKELKRLRSKILREYRDSEPTVHTSINADKTAMYIYVGERINITGK